MIKKIGAIGSMCMLALIGLGPTIAAAQDVSYVTDLLAGQEMKVGTVTADYYDIAGGDDYIKITFEITNISWALNETHVDVQTAYEDFPLGKKANPKVGNFAYLNDSHKPGEITYTYIVYGEWTNTTLYVAAQAVVNNYTYYINETGVPIYYYRYESAWGNGTQFNEKKSWAMYFTVEIPKEDI
jgi:hypothetical protein